jgi:hypothetical protein
VFQQLYSGLPKVDPFPIEPAQVPVQALPPEATSGDDPRADLGSCEASTNPGNGQEENQPSGDKLGLIARSIALGHVMYECDSGDQIHEVIIEEILELFESWGGARSDNESFTVETLEEAVEFIIAKVKEASSTERASEGSLQTD